MGNSKNKQDKAARQRQLQRLGAPLKNVKAFFYPLEKETAAFIAVL
ncbi:MAG: hypothetical protein HYX61_05670 [Gammaproteobacteria bacterium]|jgi:hypothetical protein|nr:hypothetical protein [Gammaproteobacteria bacterium]